MKDGKPFPDADEVYADLLKSEEVSVPLCMYRPSHKKLLQRKSHKNGVSTFAFAFARLISVMSISSQIFKKLIISIKQLSISGLEGVDLQSNAPNYLDLSPLYGPNETETDKIRIKDGSGMLFPDCFYDDRFATFPNAVSALLILWNRNHNVCKRCRFFYLALIFHSISQGDL